MNAKLKNQKPEFRGEATPKAVSSVAAFTLIEIMVVVALVGIMIAGVFKLISAAGRSNQRATTVQRIQKLENALSGFYAEYGTYPPVERHDSPDPRITTEDDSNNDATGFADRCKRAAASQPVSYEFPCKKRDDKWLELWFKTRGRDVVSANQAVGAYNKNEPAWKDTKGIKLGLLSYLLPRLQVMAEFNSSYGMDSQGGPDPAFFELSQWSKYNNASPGNYREQLERETVACSRWLLNFEEMIAGGGKVLGVSLGDKRHGVSPVTYKMKNGQRIGLMSTTILDGWDRPLYYQSLPPYQSYRVWSAGPDGNTFPPDFPMDLLSSDERRDVSEWIKDDIVGFDR